MRNLLFVIILLMSSLQLTFAQDKCSHFWYAQPASDWKSALPIGNGRIGGMIFGDPSTEQIVINENTIWCGPPLPPNNPKGPELINKMRNLIFNGKYEEAVIVCEKEFADGVHENARSYQPFGFLNIDFKDKGAISNYKRWLDYTKAITYVSYTQNGVTYTREAFVSKPNEVMVVRITADKPGQVSFKSKYTRPFGATTKAENNRSQYVQGQAYAENGEFVGVKFEGIINYYNEGGKIKANGTDIEINNANSVTIMIAISTDYNIHDTKNVLTHNRKKICEKQLSQAQKLGYKKLKQTHIDEYSALYNRSSFDIAFNTPVNNNPIDKRIQLAASGQIDSELLFEYYNYCRYLFISSSRKGGLPMNLQGIWNPLMLAPWRSNFHINVNIQEAYWFAEQANLSECHEPMFTLTENLIKNGKETAQVMFGTKRGSVAGHRTDAWFYAPPTFLKAHWGMSITNAAWLCLHHMEHYRYTLDKEFLKTRALPVLRETALFSVDWLVPDPRSGKLVSGPTASPENRFKVNGKVASLTMSCTYDQEIIWNTFRDFLEACKILGISNEETVEVEASMKKLSMPTIANDGRLMEWTEELEETEPGHRHISHLWGMMPGNRITQDKTPHLVDAVRKSLDYRLNHNYHAQGWSLGWVTSMLARLKEGDKSLDMMQHNYFTKAYPNMFVDAHGRPQVGDMMGVPLAMIELILQSHTDYIDLLPSLPTAWKDGKVTGLCARGAFVFDMEWKAGKLISTNIKSLKGGKCLLRYEGKVKELSTEAGKSYQVTF